MAQGSAVAKPRRAGNGMPAGGVALIVIYAALVVSPLFIAAAFRPVSSHSFAFEMGKSAGLAGTMILVLNLVLAARLRWIDRAFGLDLVMRFHRAMAIVGVVLLTLHPLLMAASDAGWELLTSRSLPWWITLGKVALLLLWAQGITSILQGRLFRYEVWRMLHNVLLVMLALVVLHTFARKDIKLPVMQVLWYGAMGLAVLAWVMHRLVWPRKDRARGWRVTSVKQETHNVFTLELSPPNGTRVPEYLPGQFHFLSLYRDDRHNGEEHPFTISSSPTTEGALTSTIKASGDFTATVGETMEGAQARVQGPFGRFSYLLAPSDDLVMIAGGIGITPFMSMLRQMRDTSADLSVTLLYANRTDEDIAFRDELAEIATGELPRLALTHVLSEPAEGWEGEVGLVNRDKIHRFVGGDLNEKTFFVCGPPMMMNSVVRKLRKLGVHAGQIHTERFAL